jgi:hypothetical protein
MIRLRITAEIVAVDEFAAANLFDHLSVLVQENFHGARPCEESVDYGRATGNGRVRIEEVKP